MPVITHPQKHDAYADVEVDAKGYKPYHLVNTQLREHLSAIRKHYESIDAKVDNSAGHKVPFTMGHAMGSSSNDANDLMDPYTMGEYYDVEFFERDDTQVLGDVDIEEFFKGNLYLFGVAKDNSYNGKCHNCGTNQAFIAHKDGVIQGHINKEGFFSAEEKCCGIHPIEIEINVPTGELVFFEYIGDKMLDEILQLDTNKHYGKVQACKHFESKNLAFCFLGDESPDILKLDNDDLQIRGELYYTDEVMYEQHARYTREILLSEEWPNMVKKIEAYHKEFGKFENIGHCCSNAKMCTFCDESTLSELFPEYAGEVYSNSWLSIDVRVKVTPGRYRITNYADAWHPLDTPWRHADRYSLEARSIDAIITRIGDINENV